MLFDFSTYDAINAFFMPFLDHLVPYVGREGNPKFDTEVPLKIVEFLKTICMRIIVEFPAHKKIMKKSWEELHCICVGKFWTIIVKLGRNEGRSIQPKMEAKPNQIKATNPPTM